ncbi:MAG: IS481 family transposase [Proteobacteria bacterium]|nr:IS481 family transposase [Pseudomonadota bacterium]
MVFWKKKKKANSSYERATNSSVQASSTVPKKRKILPLEVKLVAVEAREIGLQSQDISEIIGASPTTIDKWFRIWREQGTEGLMKGTSNPGVRKMSAKLRDRIERFRRDNPEMGVRTISSSLKRNEAISVSPESVRTVLNEAGLGNPPQQSKRRPPQIRRFERELPNAMWQIDIFTFELKRMYKVYLVGIIDDHSRYIVGHGLFRQQTAEAVQEVVQGAIGQWGAPREILSDNGRQFASWRGKTKFQKTLTRQGIQHVRSAPHHPMTLGKIERFWKTIWTEFLEDASFASFADARQRLDHWIGYYNHQRPHQGIDGAAPADRFYGVAADVEEALRQGCGENALQLALGQETRPPLYLLGKLGETDVRVTRRGEEIEVKLGDTVHETIRMGSAVAVTEDGQLEREDKDGSLAGDDGQGKVPGGGDGEKGGEAGNGDLRNVRSESVGALQGDREGGISSHVCAGTEDSGTQTEVRGGDADYRAFEEECIFGEREESVEVEV